eukprot:scaffold10787_cov63-Phaeocystis_antarctica.AAC.4
MPKPAALEKRRASEIRRRRRELGGARLTLFRASGRGLGHEERGAEVYRLEGRRLAAVAWEVRACGRGLGMGRNEPLATGSRGYP